MEEFVGGLWDRIVNRAAGGHFPAAAVTLKEMEGTLGILYRAFGGDAGLRIGGAAEVRHGAQRKWLSRVAGSDERVALAAVSDEALRLPALIDCFAERELNRDLYVWLAALAGCDVAPRAAWIERNRAATREALTRFPGLAERYRRLVAAHLATRLPPEKLPPAEAADERAIRTALENPLAIDGPAHRGDFSQDAAAGEPAHADGPAASSATKTAARGAKASARRTPAKPPQPVLLWLSPDSAAAAGHDAAEEAAPSEEGGGLAGDEDKERTHKSERVEMPQPKSPFLLMFRAESLLTWGEYLHVNRALDDDPDPGAKDVARDMDHLSLARGGPPAKSKVKFDLDLPSAAHDDIRLGDGIPLPEWDYRKGMLVADYCRLQPMLARDATAQALPSHLLRPARQLRQRFSALAGARRWQRAQFDGEEIDLDACVRFFVEQGAAGGPSAASRAGGPRQAATAERGLYAQRRANERDLACLLLADLSMSTDAFVSDRHRVIDVIRDSAFLFCEALAATGDRFGVYGFSSVKRNHVRLHVVKDFAARYDGLARGRIAALKPGYYTRMGAAIRQASRILAEQPAARRLLLLISDGKPNDLDQYDSRYGVEDTRMAIIEARRLGLTPFCVTIDRDGGGYLPHLFGQQGFAVVNNPEELPARLPRLYAQISGHS